MKLFFESGHVRILLTHFVAMQLPEEISRVFYDLSSTFRQYDDATSFFFTEPHWPKLFQFLFERFPRRFAITINR